MPNVRLLLCSSCSGARNRDAERSAIMAELTKAGLTGQVELHDHACFSTCAEPVALALQGGAGRASYVFSGLDPVKDAADIAATCQTYLNSSAGWIEDARPCGRLRVCLRSRMPAYSVT